MINWWHGLNERERHLVSIGDPLLLFAVLYFAGGAPLLGGEGAQVAAPAVTEMGHGQASSDQG